MASLMYMRDFLAHRYSKRWVDKKTDEEVIRIYHSIMAREERRQKNDQSRKGGS